ncbi:type-2 ice-structuring protein-like [Cheilinus undulatus]|uniref:type-2 ice-structuring protein-like n=1 Tax=Cheilinus undulatus TaxID=241271 RepID=UPI001BD52D8A|nr:type-2 ice-structuring protein-like [Cheilinus undulatus]XP_041641854.1 type-2 ice-structuring protein-like [Cheilinus undulatus]
MKLLAVSALVCAVVVLTNAAAYRDLFKRQSGEWTTIGDRQYLYVDIQQTWHKAEQNCAQLGGKLASVHSQKDNQELGLLITRMTGGKPIVWLGGTDQHQEGNWVWSDGSVFNYKNWCWREPNNDWNQDCLQMNYGSDQCWDDDQCNEYRSSICSKPK